MSVFNIRVCCEDIKSGKTFFSFSERAFDIIFRSTFNKEMGLQFFMNLLSLSFFSTNLMIACLRDIIKFPFSLVSHTESTKISFSLFKMFHKILWLSHRYLEICHFAYFSENRLNLFLLNPHQKILIYLQGVLKY